MDQVFVFVFYSRSPEADPKNSERATRTLASHIDTIYFIENSSKNLKFHRERGGRGPLS